MRTYKFEVIVKEDDNNAFWDGVKQYESPTNRWVKRHIEEHLSDGELYDVTVTEIEALDDGFDILH